MTEPRQLTLDDELPEHDGLTFGEWVEALPAGERTVTKRLSDDGRRLIIVERWLDWQHSPPRWRSKNRHVKLKASEVEYHRQREEPPA